MVSLTALWLPILVAAIAVFIASSIIHMMMPYHKSDYRQLPDEDKVVDLLRGENLTPGIYHFPHSTQEDMNKPEMRAKFDRGPVGQVIIIPQFSMTKFLVLWLGYCLIVTALTAHLVGSTHAAGAAFKDVFHTAAMSSFMAYGVAILANAVWKGAPPSNVAKEFFDGIIYACITGATFAWLWPK